MYNVRFIYVSTPVCQDKRGRARLFAHQIRKFKRKACVGPWMLKCPTCIGEKLSVLTKQPHTTSTKNFSAAVVSFMDPQEFFLREDAAVS